MEQSQPQQQEIETLKAKLAALTQPQQDQQQPAEQAPAQEPVDSALAERRTHFSGAQRRLAATLSRGDRAFDSIDRPNPCNVEPTSDQLVTLQVIALMAEADGSDGIIYAVTNWKRGSKQTLTERMCGHKSQFECNPAYRISMQPLEKQRVYGKKEAGIMKLPYAEPKPEPKLQDINFPRMSSAEFAEFVVKFHRKVLKWNLKQFVYDNLETPAPTFFKEFVAMQKQADSKEESIYKGAYSAHLRAVDPDLGEDEAQDFLELLRWMAGRDSYEAELRADRIKKREQKLAEMTPVETVEA